MPCGWKGNRYRMSYVALAMRHWFIHLRAHGLRGREMSTPREVWHALPLSKLGQMSTDRDRGGRCRGADLHMSGGKCPVVSLPKPMLAPLTRRTSAN